jgi:hypothetical protein
VEMMDPNINLIMVAWCHWPQVERNCENWHYDHLALSCRTSTRITNAPSII